MTQIVELSSFEVEAVIGGVGGHTEIDPKTGETVTYDCTGREIARS